MAGVPFFFMKVHPFIRLGFCLCRVFGLKSSDFSVLSLITWITNYVLLSLNNTLTKLWMLLNGIYNIKRKLANYLQLRYTLLSNNTTTLDKE